ncbi:hypothetical protein NL676_037278 [Syzygium grande]|nr:hypothetical protein NL676_037278 [Syzygium grande]
MGSKVTTLLGSCGVATRLAKPFLGASTVDSISAFGFPSSDLGRRPPLQFLILTPSSRKLQIKAVGSTFGTHFRVTTFGESHGGGVGCIVDGCPPRLPFSEADLQLDLDRSEMSIAYRPSHADATYDMKYGVRSVQGGGRSSTRETIGRVTSGAIAKKIPKEFSGIEVPSFSALFHFFALDEKL